jgi:hypothetical protein
MVKCSETTSLHFYTSLVGLTFSVPLAGKVGLEESLLPAPVLAGGEWRVGGKASLVNTAAYSQPWSCQGAPQPLPAWVQGGFWSGGQRGGTWSWLVFAHGKCDYWVQYPPRTLKVTSGSRAGRGRPL